MIVRPQNDHGRSRSNSQPQSFYTNIVGNNAYQPTNQGYQQNNQINQTNQFYRPNNQVYQTNNQSLLLPNLKLSQTNTNIKFTPLPSTDRTTHSQIPPQNIYMPYK